jgi:hypothetical protein
VTQSAHGHGSKAAVLAAMGANFAIAVGKLVAGILTGSAAMLAEAGHSVADTVNQVFLLIGINLSDTVPDGSHPHGYGKEAFFWSFLAAIFIFVAGAAFRSSRIGQLSRTTSTRLRRRVDAGLRRAGDGDSVRDRLVHRRYAKPDERRPAKGMGVLRYIREAPDRRRRLCSSRTAQR